MTTAAIDQPAVAAPRTTSLPELIAEAARRDGSGRALAGVEGSALRWHELELRVRGVVAAVRRRGIEPADVVALSLANGLDEAVTLLGVMSAAVAAPQNPGLSAAEVRRALQAVGAKLVVAEAGSHASVAAKSLGIRSVSFSDLLETDTSTAADEAPQPSADAVLLPTTGTTGTSKLVPLSHANLTAAASTTAETIELEACDACLNVMPLFHTHGLVGGLLASLSAGASVVCVANVHEILRAADRWRSTWTTASPAVHHALLNEAREHPRRMAFRFVRSVSAPLSLALHDELERVYRAPAIEAYALTEAPSVVTSNLLPPRPRKPGTVGRAYGCEIRLVDEGRPVGDGAAGEVLVRGPNVMRGYVGGDDPFLDGWLRTGDVGRLDDEGFLTIVGRIKEMINRGGEKVAPAEVDATLQLHPAVGDGAAFGVPHRTLGEDVWAAVTLRPGASATPRELAAFVRERLAPFKAPTRVLVVERIPRTSTGKLRRHRLAVDLGVVEEHRGPAVGAAGGSP